MSDVRKKRLALLIGSAVAIVGALIVVVVLVTARRESAGDARAGDRVKIELRAKSVAKIRKDGRLLGTTPMTIIVPRSKQPMTLDAVFDVKSVNFAKQKQKIETFQQTKTIVPDDDQSVDFDVKQAAIVEMREERAR